MKEEKEYSEKRRNQIEGEREKSREGKGRNNKGKQEMEEVKNG